MMKQHWENKQYGGSILDPVINNDESGGEIVIYNDLQT